MKKRIKTALVSVYDKSGIDTIIKCLEKNEVTIFSTGGTYDYITNILKVEAKKIEDITTYPSILNGRVKTLHPKVFGGILYIRGNEEHEKDVEKYDLPSFDLVIVDLYPFEDTIKQTSDHQTIIENIDIGGVSLIRAAAKNYQDVVVICSPKQYEELHHIIQENNCSTDLATRKLLARKAFATIANYDVAIFNWLDDYNNSELKISCSKTTNLRYGENPHQSACYYGNINEIFTKIQGKEISYNNILDIDSAINLIREFSQTTLAIIKHTNVCGIASRPNLSEAWQAALNADPVSAFGGIIITNDVVDNNTAELINKIFFEVIIAPKYTKEALDILQQKTNRIILIDNMFKIANKNSRTALNGVLMQDTDTKSISIDNINFVTNKQSNPSQIKDFIFGEKVVKHLKSNAIAIVKDLQLIGCANGQSSRVDAVEQAINKAKKFNFNLKDAVLASDAFFPFADSLEFAKNAGIDAIIQPGGSIRDKEVIEFANNNDMAMVFTDIRHFKH